MSALPHASRNWSRECNRPNAHEQLLFWQRFLQCHRDENNSQDNYRRASFISRHCTPPSRVSLFRNLRFISATRPASGCRRDARRFCTLAKIMTGGTTGSEKDGGEGRDVGNHDSMNKLAFILSFVDRR